ncbi:hypothetical protein RclHR1_13730002 [Rhizophagus clarus]|uniref:Uncharacterized protein n=1 Tax=Rhizophagus clarus TaxID=94130 RepID=A0A2Z6QFC8_9GLOM|nr:hypothetical protein RclHR1_13730002 [Rhizophagus clarus]
MSSHTSQNAARRGGSFPNTNSRRANRHNKRNNNNNSDNSSSDAADVEVDGPSSSPKENNTALTSLASPPNDAAASSTPCNNASDGLNASMHARTMTPASPSNASPNEATVDDLPVDIIPILSPTFSFDRNDWLPPNSAPETLKKFPTNKALIDAVNNTFLEMYESYTGKARITGSNDSKRLVIYF